MAIRNAALEDLEKVYGLLCELENTQLPREEFQEIYTGNLNNPQIFYFVCEEEKEITAFASLHIQNLLHHCSKIAEIQELVVTSKLKGTGIGTRLFQTLEKTAKENGCSLLEVCCNQKRKRSHGFYEHCGMTNSHYKFTLNL